MLTFTRTVTCATDKFPAGLAFAREISAFIKAKIGIDFKVQVAPVGGNPFRIRWHGQYESLADLDRKMQVLLADPKYMEIAGKAAAQGITLSGTTQDEVWVDL